MPGDHPIAWCQPYDGGRSFYTAGGHTSASFSDAQYRAHLYGALAWAAGWVPGDCTATIETSWERTVLDGDVSDPIELAVAPNGYVFFVERNGALKVWDPADGGHTHLMATLPVTTSYEDGLLGITLDPDFAQNGWAYLYYSPAGTESVQRVSRFTITGESIDLGSEAVLLTVRDRPGPGRPLGRLAHVRARRAPLHRDRRRRRPVRLVGLHAHRRAPGPGVVGRPADVGQPVRPAGQGPADPADARRDGRDPGRATCSRPTARPGAPRSSRWASATRSA